VYPQECTPRSIKEEFTSIEAAAKEAPILGPDLSLFTVASILLSERSQYFLWIFRCLFKVFSTLLNSEGPNISSLLVVVPQSSLSESLQVE
jgi:hypothetical protein